MDAEHVTGYICLAFWMYMGWLVLKFLQLVWLTVYIFLDLLVKSVSRLMDLLWGEVEDTKELGKKIERASRGEQ